MPNSVIGALAAPERNNFFYGKLMDVPQWEKDVSYSRLKRSLLNRLVLGSGVICGLDLAMDPAGTVTLQPGMALDDVGREIIVPEPVSFDPHQPTDDQGAPSGARLAAGSVDICLAYAESLADPVPVLVPSCDTPGNCACGTV